MVAGDPKDLTLDDILQPREATPGLLCHLLLFVRLVVVVAVGDISSHEAVVEMGAIGADGGGETLEDLHVEVDVCDDDDVQGLSLELEV